MKKKFLIVFAIGFILSFTAIIGVEYYTSRPDFCASCHIMKKYHTSWNNSKHNETLCVDCHYAPGERSTIKAKMQGMARVFSYIARGDKEVRTKALVKDESCTRSKCHPYEEFRDKKIKFTEKISYIHKTHDDKTIEGQRLHCNSCHIHMSKDKHFEVPKESCYLCHFKNEKFNEGRGKCSLCHEIPTAPLQKQKEPEDKPITHESLETAKVPCSSCHYELILGKGEIKKEVCQVCHDAPEVLNKAEDKELMHKDHVGKQNANCFQCHMLIQHKEFKFVEPIIENCSGCHPEHHTYQKQLLLGGKGVETDRMPALMFDVKTNCFGCHIETEYDKKGQKISKASEKSCIACHTKRHGEMLDEWKDKLKLELEEANKLRKYAEKTIARYKGKISEEKMEKAIKMMEEGRKNLNIVEYGNGIHNKKYSIKLIDSAMNNFEDLVDFLLEDD